jgi:soluble lytic murein transglycosylase-like protein
MLKKTAALLILMIAPAVAHAQQRPLSPHARPPVPLTDADQERARQETSSKRKEPVAPLAPLDRHISSGNAALDRVVNEAAALHGIDPCLIFSVMKAESAFNRTAVSPKGASGLMQLMPATATRFGVRNIFDPKENVFGGAKYLKWLLDRFGGDVRLALAGYNAGEGAIEFYQNRIPPFAETQNYVRTIYARYSRLHSDAPAAIEAQASAGQATVATTVNEKIPTYNQIIRAKSSDGDMAKSLR